MRLLFQDFTFSFRIEEFFYNNIPVGSSPISPDGCAPIGLKYRKLIILYLSPMKDNKLVLLSKRGICLNYEYNKKIKLRLLS